MTDVIAYLSEFNAVTVMLRVLLAGLAGALVGLEREFHGRAAGMRTHMMVALGAALTAMIGLYTVSELGIDSDPLRVGAQVISGVPRSAFDLKPFGSPTLSVIGKNVAWSPALRNIGNATSY